MALRVSKRNLSDAEHRIEGAMPASQLGIALDRYYQRTERWASLGNAQLTVGCTLPTPRPCRGGAWPSARGWR